MGTTDTVLCKVSGLAPSLNSGYLLIAAILLQIPANYTYAAARSLPEIADNTAKAIPKFSSEAAERAFWEKNDSTENLDWGKAQVATFPNLKPSTRTISLRLPQHLLDAIKTAANARDVPYQSLIKVWLQEKVQRG